MREPVRRRKKKSGCGGCLGALLSLLIILAVLVAGANFLVEKFFDSDLSGKIQQTQFPIKYEYFVEKYSEEYNLDKFLVYAVIRTESRFDKYAVSSADAKGLMQLTDETARFCSRKIGMESYTESSLFDPEININLGCYYLSYLIDKYDNINTALAAYNGGPGNVDEWLADSSHSDTNGNLVDIPFKETRNYVLRVNETKEMYKEIYGE